MPTKEEILHTDVQLIKQKQDHADKMMQSLLEQVVIVGENLTKLTVSSQELVIESRTANKRIDDMEKTLDTHHARVEDDFRSLGQRIVVLENFKLTHDTLLHQGELNKKWWSDNWHKIVMLGVLLIPVIVAIERLIMLDTSV